MPFSKYSQYPMVGRISANGIKILFTNDHKYPVVSCDSVNSIKNIIFF